MKVVILAGGLGTRISEETALRPKPMIDIGGRPLLWHIMKHYGAHGFHDFIICLGYKGYMIKEYFFNYHLHVSDVTFDLSKRSMEVHRSSAEPWSVTLVDTGEQSMTGGRIKRVANFVGDETFLCTYGDGVSDVNVRQTVADHRAAGRYATMTAVQPPGRFGALQINGDLVTEFREKPAGDQSWINGGFFVLEPAVFDYISGDDCVWELDPLERLAHEGQLQAYKHTGFWQPVDTLRERMHLENLWNSGSAPWKTWD